MKIVAYRESVWPVVHNRASIVSCPKVLDLSQVIPAVIIIKDLSQTIKIFQISQILNQKHGTMCKNRNILKSPKSSLEKVVLLKYSYLKISKKSLKSTLEEIGQYKNLPNL